MRIGASVCPQRSASLWPPARFSPPGAACPPACLSRPPIFLPAGQGYYLRVDIPLVMDRIRREGLVDMHNTSTK